MGSNSTTMASEREHVRQHAPSEAVVVLAAGSSQILVENAHRSQLSLPMRNALTL